jgi:hypothetical protein
MNRFKRRFREDASFPSKIRKQVGSVLATMPVRELSSSCVLSCLCVLLHVSEVPCKMRISLLIISSTTSQALADYIRASATFHITVLLTLKGAILQIFVPAPQPTFPALLRLVSTSNLQCSNGMQELDDLQTITQPEHVKTNRMAQAARRMRYPVPMCSYSYTLLECFLQAHKLKLPLHTINEHIDLQVSLQCS